jgi:hypothetical protein
MKKGLLAAIFVFALAMPALLAQTSSIDAPATREDILKLFDVMQLRQQMRTVMDLVMQQTRATTREELRKRNPKITSQQLARAESIAEEAIKDFPIEAMLDDVVPVYQKHLTKADVDAMTSFYSSATGQKLLREMPAMTSESMQVAYARMQKQMDSMKDRIDKQLQQEQEKEKKSAEPKPQT